MAAKTDTFSNKQKQLDDVIARAQQKKAELRQQQLQATRERIDAILLEAGFDLKEIYGTRVSKRVGKRASAGKPKFRNPKDPSQTWSGYGRSPRWFTVAVNAGVSESDLLINPPPKGPVSSRKGRAGTKAATGKGKTARGARKAVKRPTKTVAKSKSIRGR
jgi:DNA-binding protein H-NS